jgi:hypothetical protein
MAFDQLIAGLRERREKWLALVRLRLGTLRSLAVSWDALAPLVAGNVALLQSLHDELMPVLRLPVAQTTSTRRLRFALRELIASIRRFNQRWRSHLETVDLAEINRLIDGYNRYYLLEKECAFRSARLARQGFRPLLPVSVGMLLELVPVMEVPLKDKTPS